jgi:hypothetical protein
MPLDLIRTTRGVRPWEDNSERMLEAARKRRCAVVPGEALRDLMVRHDPAGSQVEE